MIDDKAQEAIMEAYEKSVLKNEVTLNEQGNTIFDVADIFTRFLIGDRQVAIRQLQQLEKKPIKGIDGKNGIIDSVLHPDGNMEDWNNLFGNLRNDFKKIITKRSKL